MPLRVLTVCQAIYGKPHPGIRFLYSSSRDRWQRFIRIRPLHTGSGHLLNGQGQGKTQLQENGWEPWSDTKNWTTARANQVNDKNIVMGDLKATLDAHRTANRIRKIKVPDKPPPISIGFRQLDLSARKHIDTGTDEVEGKFRIIRMPAPKVFHPTTNGDITFSVKRLVLKGQDCPLVSGWQLKKSSYNHSPWTDGIERTAAGPGIERLVWRSKLSEGF